MSRSFRVVDLRARSPEEAAREALGIELVRSGAKRDIAAKVYWQPVGQPLTMVRLYSKVDGVQP